MQRDTIFNENEDGSLNVQDYVEGAETFGDDYIVGHEGKKMKGGNVLNSQLVSGSGNDQIILTGDVLNSLIEMGKGNDYFKLAGNLINTVLKMEEGDDRVHIQGMAVDSDIAEGKGEDITTVDNNKRVDG